MDLSQLIDPVKRIAQEAGRLILEDRNRAALTVNTKTDDSPVSNADLRAHGHILSELKKLTPELPILSEEGEIPAFSVRKKWDYYWLVDPLDGTRGFIEGGDEFTVNIALIRGKRPVLGVIELPPTQDLYWAIDGQGSFRQSPQLATHRIFSSPRTTQDHLIIVKSRSQPSPFYQRFLDELPNYEVRKISSSLKFCLLATGEADIYARFGRTMEWDTAAGDCIFANSAIKGQHPSSLVYNKEDLLNPPFLIGANIPNELREFVQSQLNLYCPPQRG